MDTQKDTQKENDPSIANSKHHGRIKAESDQEEPPRPCNSCAKVLPKESYSKTQWRHRGKKKFNFRCKVCISSTGDGHSMSNSETPSIVKGNIDKMSGGEGKKKGFSSKDKDASAATTAGTRKVESNKTKNLQEVIKAQRSLIKRKTDYSKDAKGREKGKKKAKMMNNDSNIINELSQETKDSSAAEVTCSPRKVKKQRKKKDPKKEESSSTEVTATTKKENDKSKDAKGKGKGRKKAKKTFESDPAVIEAKLKHRPFILPSPSYKTKTFEIDWVSSIVPVTREDEQTMGTRIVKRGKFGLLNEEEKRQISSYIASSKISMRLPQALSLRSSLLRQKAMHNNFSLLRQSKKMHRLYEEHDNPHCILSLSQKVDCPPVNVFRAILGEMKYSKGKIKASLRDPKKHLPPREQECFSLAEANDIVACVDQGRIMEYADAFEVVFEEWLKEKGIAFVKQSELVKEQKEEFGKSILTPDFLFLDELLINGSPVRWLDCKAFYGSSIPFTVDKMKKQMKRYIKHWGGGGILFLQGYSEALEMDGCILLSAWGVLDDDVLSGIEKGIMQAVNPNGKKSKNTTRNLDTAEEGDRE